MISKSKIKHIHSLKHKKFRQKYNLFVAEGEKIALTLVQQNEYQIKEIVCTPKWGEKNELIISGNSVLLATTREMEILSNFTNSPPVLMLVKIPPQVTTNFSFNRAIYLDDVQDPGNVGTLLRIADWFGVQAVYRSESSADFFNPKVVSGSMGSFANVHLQSQSPSSFLKANTSTRIYAASINGSEVFTKPGREPLCLVIGNEGRGLSRMFLEKADVLIKIPGARGRLADSLNASVAGGILCDRLFNHD